jgi:hypothetical protein
VPIRLLASTVLLAAVACAQSLTQWRPLPARDAVDLRILREVREGSGRIIRWVREAGR